MLLEMNVVTRDDPFHCTDDDAIKLLPVRVRVKPTLPAVVDVGEMAVRVGAGLFTVTTGDDAILVNVPVSDVRDCVVKV